MALQPQGRHRGERLDAKTGTLIWSRKLTRNNREGIDMTPQLYDNTVLFSTVPGNGLASFYKGGADCGLR